MSPGCRRSSFASYEGIAPPAPVEYAAIDAELLKGRNRPTIRSECHDPHVLSGGQLRSDQQFQLPRQAITVQVGGNMKNLLR
ncbi:MAG: hypothetical protein GXP24_00780 [Planctomycetes bacterium]|nr:hypothetical protein [Planctomycetota bacterium]